MRNLLIIIFFIFSGLHLSGQEVNLAFTIKTGTNLEKPLPGKGRIFFIFNKEKPKIVLNGNSYPDVKKNPVFGHDVNNWDGRTPLKLNAGFYGFPIREMKDLPAGKWYLEVLYDASTSGQTQKFYSDIREISVSSVKQNFEITLNNQAEEKKVPTDNQFHKYIEIQSQLLSAFWEKPMFLHAQVVLPQSYYTDTARKYPVLISVGGFGFGYFNEVKRKELESKDGPQMIVVFPDSKAPFGDSYQINSENNGPYGDAMVRELIPYIEKHFRCVGKSSARFLTGTSTGGWVSLALQIFYPDFFNGAWAVSPDPIDFRQFELVNIYEDENAFINKYGVERPAKRTIDGETQYTLRNEVSAENVLGRGNSYVSSGESWGSWNAVFSPKDNKTGLPMEIFDPYTGKINKSVAKAWEKYDLRLYLSQHWDSLGNLLQGKIYIATGTADNYFLNNAVNLFNKFITGTTDPRSDAKIIFINGAGHGSGYGVPFEDVLKQMEERCKNN